MTIKIKGGVKQKGGITVPPYVAPLAQVMDCGQGDISGMGFTDAIGYYTGFATSPAYGTMTPEYMDVPLVGGGTVSSKLMVMVAKDSIDELYFLFDDEGQWPAVTIANAPNIVFTDPNIGELSFNNGFTNVASFGNTVWGDAVLTHTQWLYFRACAGSSLNFEFQLP